jgi:hypothetical protein
MNRKTRKAEAEHASLSKALKAALSAEELSLATTGALLSLDDAGRQRLLERLGPQTAEALRPLLFVSEEGQSASAAPKAGKAEVLEDWEGLWSEWAECLDE